MIMPSIAGPFSICGDGRETVCADTPADDARKAPRILITAFFRLPILSLTA